MSRRILLSLLALTSVLLVLSVLSSATFYLLAKRAEPHYRGERHLPGLSAPVEIQFGPHAVPTLRAANLTDLVHAQGYVVASERHWQMDLLRRLAGGRLAELFGADAVPVDRFFRTLGLHESARTALDALDDEARALLDAHTAGINAYRDDARGRLPLEYLLIGQPPAPWSNADSLLLGAYLAWTQSYNLRAELTFLALAARLGPERARAFFPVDEGVPAPALEPELIDYLRAIRHPSNETATAFTELAATLETALAQAARFGLPVPGAASNAWAATGARTADGAALLANDPHLAPSVPGIWYELELIAPGLQVAGVALPGVPLVLIGHNADLAWGFTSTIADTQDLILERLTADARSVLRPDGRHEPLTYREETLNVRGAAPVTFQVRRTRHGAVINDILGPVTGSLMDLPAVQTRELLVLRQPDDIADASFPALLRLNRARTLDDARAAILGFRQVAQNLMLAHRDGGIAWQVSGLLPRRAGFSGAFPQPGWSDAAGWSGYWPQTENPWLVNPPGDLIVTANHRTIPLDYPVPVSHSWMTPYRAQRIRERLDAEGDWTPETMVALQADRFSRQAQLTQESVRRLGPELAARDPAAWTLAETYLLDWDATMDPDSVSAAFYLLLESALWDALYGNELGADLDLLKGMALVAYNPLQETLRSGVSDFWDDPRTPERETPADIWARALRAAGTALDERAGSSGPPTLARTRTLTFPHAFGELPLIGRLFSVGPLGVGGHSDSVAVMKTSPLTPHEASFIPSLRVVQTPAAWEDTRGTLPLGQSGHLFSPYRRDQLDDWLAGKTHAWPWNGPAADARIGVLRLLPSGADHEAP